MPTYARQCKICGYEFDHVCRISERELPVECPRCSGQTRRVYRHIAIEVFRPTVFEHMGPTPTLVTSKKQLKQLCKERGLISHYLEGTPKPRRNR